LIEAQTGVSPNGWSDEQMLDFIKEKGVSCPKLRQLKLYRYPQI
jgi:glycyl-tRNA synthetase